MDRIDEDREKRVNLERLERELRQKDFAQKKHAAAESVFAKKIPQLKDEKRPRPEKQQKSIIGAILKDQGGQRRASTLVRLPSPGLDKPEDALLSESAFAQSRRSERELTGDKSRSVQKDERAKEDSEESDDAEGSRKAYALAGRSPRSELKADSEGGGGNQGGKDKDERGGQPFAPAFRFNPNLMAPMPVVQAKEVSQSERLRVLANELAQKIVQQMRTGWNKKGEAMITLELNQDVLKGLSIRLTQKDGQIHAKFMSGDREVLKMLRENAPGLEKAMSQHKLSLKLEFEGHT